MNYSVRVDGLGKRYKVRNGQRKHRLLRDEIMDFVRQFPRKKEPAEEFWAVRNATFDIREGEKIGIIGKNGAGKSTMLKMLSRVVEPTAGQIRVRGRVASLLEVGTGFHPNLTGRENIFLNGVILGMSRSEVASKFDEIVSFSGVERFLETQVKHYSSGMYMRLAFSVAAHLDPDIFIIDEVLAVGDAEFQRKCLAKIDEVSRSGKTIIFVSHSMETVSTLCDRCVLLERGEVRRIGPSSEVINDYLGGDAHLSGRAEFEDHGSPVEDEFVKLLYGEIVGDDNRPVVEIDSRRQVAVKMGFRVKARSNHRFIPNFHFLVPGGTYAFVSTPDTVSELAPGDYEAICYVPGDMLNEGTYFIDLAISSFAVGATIHFWVQGALTLNVQILRTGVVDGKTEIFPGAVRPRLEWNLSKVG